MKYREVEKIPKNSKTIDLASTGLRRPVKLDSKPKEKIVLFPKFSLAEIGAREVDKKPHIFLTRSNKHI